jgi:hypothetical protein
VRTPAALLFGKCARKLPISNAVTATAEYPVHRKNRTHAPIGLIALSLALAILLICTAAREFESLRNLGDISSTGGTWIATSVDAEQGVLYRPLVSNDGYGGTRYAPVRTLVQAAILKWTSLGAINSALATSAASMALLLLGCYALMRRFEVPVPLAAAMTAMMLASNAVRASTLAGMSDPLAAALAIWGVVAVTSTGRFSILASSIFFSLAVATKVTSIFGLAAVVIWMVLNRQYRRAILCGLTATLATGLLFAIFEFVSHGRMLEIFRACATGGAGLSQILQAPIVFSGILCRFDPVAGAIWILALIAVFSTRQAFSLPGILLLTTTLGTLAIYGSPGTDMNHLIDLEAASLICVAICLTRAASLLPLVTFLALCGAAVSAKDAMRIDYESRRDQISRALAIAGKSPSSGPILSENPLLPILTGQRPYMLDGFMFRVFTQSNSPLARQLWNDLSHQRFRAVILCPVGGPDEWTHPGSFGYEALPHIHASYKLVAQEGQYYVFLPRPLLDNHRPPTQK